MRRSNKCSNIGFGEEIMQVVSIEVILHILSGALGHMSVSKHLLLECLPFDLLLAVDSDLRSAVPGELEFLLDDVLDPAFNLPTFKVTFPMVV